MISQLKLFLITFTIFLIIDMIWLGFISRGFYQVQLGFLMKEKVNWLAAMIFYVLFVAALIYFVIQPALNTRDVTSLIVSALFFGMITYATYDLTNLATIENWPLVITVVDILWGCVLSLMTALITYLVIV